jgi:hypothetical protein
LPYSHGSNGREAVNGLLVMPWHLFSLPRGGWQSTSEERKEGKGELTIQVLTDYHYISGFLLLWYNSKNEKKDGRKTNSRFRTNGSRKGDER